MPNRRKDYKNIELYAKTRAAQRERYYGTTSNIYPPRHWTAEEDERVLAHSTTDNKLSNEIKRSVGAIQLRRFKLKNG